MSHLPQPPAWSPSSTALLAPWRVWTTVAAGFFALLVAMALGRPQGLLAVLGGQPARGRIRAPAPPAFRWAGGKP